MKVKRIYGTCANMSRKIRTCRIYLETFDSNILYKKLNILIIHIYIFIYILLSSRCAKDVYIFVT